MTTIPLPLVAGPDDVVVLPDGALLGSPRWLAAGARPRGSCWPRAPMGGAPSRRRTGGRARTVSAPRRVV
ncbi:MAG: hypothetical protein ABSE77_10110 [Acidimicrobiales bacterium]